MTITRQEKEQIVNELTEAFKNSKGVVFTNYKGLTVDEFEDLRARMREIGGQVKVAKLTLVKRALKDAGLNIELDSSVPTAVAYSREDEVMPAKIAAKFASDTKKLEIISGILEGKLLSAAEIGNLAKLPGKQELRGQLVSVIAGPMRGLVGVFAGVERSLLYALKDLARKKGTA